MILAVDLVETNFIGLDFVLLNDAMETRERVPKLLHNVACENQREHEKVPVIRLGSRTHEGGLHELE